MRNEVAAQVFAAAAGTRRVVHFFNHLLHLRISIQLVIVCLLLAAAVAAAAAGRE